MASQPRPWTALTVLRAKTGQTRAQLGRQLITPRHPHGVGGQHIGRLEAGLRGASPETLAELARALDVDTGWLAATAPQPASQHRYYRPRGISA